ncbi:MAG: AMP-binding protein, partial [Thermoleophilia bacterium]|nr:AMP-binding protein [Thermoleophilia bacterium]
MSTPDFDWNLPEQFNFTRDVVEALAEDPNRRALTFVDRQGIITRQTFAQLALDATRWAHLLRGRGTEPGDRVVVVVGKVPDWLGIMLGALKAGLITVPCTDMLRARDLAFRVAHSGASLVVADRSTQGEIDAMRGLLEGPVDIVYLDDARLLLRHQPTTAPTEDTRWFDYAFILYTSGTTRDPKGVTHTHGYTFATRMQAEHWLGARPGDLVWCTAGTGWAKSIWNVLLGPWSRGAEIVLHEGGFDPEERFGLIDRLGVTILCQSPTEYRLMAKLDALERHPLSRLRHAVSAGEPLNPEVIERFREAFGITIYDGYGQTENTLLVANTRSSEVRPGSMGLPTPGHDVDVIGDDGQPVARGVEGDIALRGRPPSLFARYWQDRDETAAVFRGDWYVTGDRAVRDEAGYFWFTGRADDVITSAGYRIGPFEVENALLEHAAVAESAAVGKPDPDRGEIVKAFVVLRAGIEPSDELAHELQEHAKALTSPHKYPREIEFVDALPKTRSGKIRRVELRQLEHERAIDERARAASPAAPTAVAPGAASAAAEAEARRTAEEAGAEARRAEEAAARNRAREQADAERRAREQAEAERRAVEADAERRAREQVDADRRAHEQAEAERRAREQADAVRAAEEALAARGLEGEHEVAEHEAAEHEAAEHEAAELVVAELVVEPADTAVHDAEDDAQRLSWRERRAQAKRERLDRERQLAHERAERAAAERAAHAAAEDARAAAEADRLAAEKATREPHGRRAVPPPQPALGQGAAEEPEIAEGPNPALVARLQAYRIAPSEDSPEN